MTSPRVYEDPIGTDEVQEQRGVEPDEVREGLHDVDGKGDDRAEGDGTAAEGEDVSDPGGDSDPGAAAGS